MNIHSVALLTCMSLTGCPLDIKHTVDSSGVEPVMVQICLDDWLYDTQLINLFDPSQDKPVLDTTGGQLPCQ